MNARLQGRVVLVTGAGRGIGHAVAARLAAEGAAVAVHCRQSIDGAAALVERIRTDGGQADVFNCDLRDVTACNDMLAGIEARLGMLDCLVLNAAISRGAPLLAADFDALRETLETNLVAPMQLAALALPGMLRARFGRIVAIGSVVGEHGGLTGQCAYAASKAGLAGFIRTLANELSPRGDFTANIVAPGVVPTDLSAAAIEDFGEQLAEHIPLRRYGTPDDIAGAVAYLLSADGAYVNGQTLAVDGGFSLRYIARPSRRASRNTSP